jgi:hypothetical protein
MSWRDPPHRRGPGHQPPARGPRQVPQRGGHVHRAVARTVLHLQRLGAHQVLPERAQRRVQVVLQPVRVPGHRRQRDDQRGHDAVAVVPGTVDLLDASRGRSAQPRRYPTRPGVRVLAVRLHHEPLGVHPRTLPVAGPPGADQRPRLRRPKQADSSHRPAAGDGRGPRADQHLPGQGAKARANAGQEHRRAGDRQAGPAGLHQRAGRRRGLVEDARGRGAPHPARDHRLAGTPQRPRHP